MAAIAIGAAVVPLASPSTVAGGAPRTRSAGGDQPVEVPVDVDVSQVVRPINRNLVGVHGRDSAERVSSAAFDDISPTTFRHVMSDYDLLDFDCATNTISPASIAYFDTWLDAVQAGGARPILALSYVPPCFARDGQPKGPPTPAGVPGYRAFLDDLFGALVTARAKAGKEPLRWFELWNEPDIPIDRGNTSTGHGYVGTLDEYVAGNLPSLIGAVLQAQSDSGEQLHVGMPASFAPWSFGSVYGDLAGMLERANGFDPATAASLAANADTAFGAGTTDRVVHNGGVTWGRRVTDEAAKLGLTIDFASVHLYPNNPLQSLATPEKPTPALLAGRNPDATPEDYARLATIWHDEFPSQELVVSEWALSAGSDFRFGTCETASFDAAALAVMQTTSIDRALYLGHPGGVEDAPFRAWTDLPADQVAATLPSTGASGLWVTAAHDANRTTVLLSQWHSRLVDALNVTAPVVIRGLTDGEYDVDVTRVGEGTTGAADSTTESLSSVDGVLEVPAVPLRGQSLVRIDVHPASVPALRPLTAATKTPAAATCLPKLVAQPGGSTTTTTAAPDGSATGSDDATPATPIEGTPAFTG